MPLQQTIDRLDSFELLAREVTGLAQRRVLNEHRMAFREQKAVAIWVPGGAGLDIHCMEIQYGQRFRQ